MSLAFRVGKKEHMMINKNKSDVFPRLNILLNFWLYPSPSSQPQETFTNFFRVCEAMVATETVGGIDPLYPHGYTWAAPPEVAQPAR